MAAFANCQSSLNNDQLIEQPVYISNCIFPDMTVYKTDYNSITEKLIKRLFSAGHKVSRDSSTILSQGQECYFENPEYWEFTKYF